MTTYRAILSLPAMLAVFLSGLSAPASAQTVISAVGGLIHYSEGRVYIDNSPLLYDPMHFVHLRENQRLRTTRGRVELMLVPDVLVRLDSGAEIEMVSANLTAARIQLVSGSCTVEVRRKFDVGAAEVQIGEALVRFEKNGLYRLKNPREETASVQVFRGKAEVTTAQARYKLKPYRALVLGASTESHVEKLDRLEFALLDDWTRVGDTGRRLSTLGQSDQAMAAVVSTRLHCETGGDCRVTGLDCVLPALANRRVLSYSGHNFSRAQVR